MKIVLQRVQEASVTVEHKLISRIGQGLLLLVGIEEGDSEDECRFMADKVSRLRIFSDQSGKMNLSIAEIGGEILCVSQFTLCADWKKGRRPGFTGAAKPEIGKILFDRFVELLQGCHMSVKTGIFGANMKVTLVNDGPVTLIMEHKQEKQLGSQEGLAKS